MSVPRPDPPRRSSSTGSCVQISALPRPGRTDQANGCSFDIGQPLTTPGGSPRGGEDNSGTSFPAACGFQGDRPGVLDSERAAQQQEGERDVGREPHARCEDSIRSTIALRHHAPPCGSGGGHRHRLSRIAAPGEPAGREREPCRRGHTHSAAHGLQRAGAAPEHVRDHDDHDDHDDDPARADDPGHDDQRARRTQRLPSPARRARPRRATRPARRQSLPRPARRPARAPHPPSHHRAGHGRARSTTSSTGRPSTPASGSRC